MDNSPRKFDRMLKVDDIDGAMPRKMPKKLNIYYKGQINNQNETKKDPQMFDQVAATRLRNPDTIGKYDFDIPKNDVYYRGGQKLMGKNYYGANYVHPGTNPQNFRDSLDNLQDQIHNRNTSRSPMQVTQPQNIRPPLANRENNQYGTINNLNNINRQNAPIDQRGIVNNPSGDAKSNKPGDIGSQSMPIRPENHFEQMNNDDQQVQGSYKQKFNSPPIHQNIDTQKQAKRPEAMMPAKNVYYSQGDNKAYENTIPLVGGQQISVRPPVNQKAENPMSYTDHLQYKAPVDEMHNDLFPWNQDKKMKETMTGFKSRIDSPEYKKGRSLERKNLAPTRKLNYIDENNMLYKQNSQINDFINKIKQESKPLPDVQNIYENIKNDRRQYVEQFAGMANYYSEIPKNLRNMPIFKEGQPPKDTQYEMFRPNALKNLDNLKLY